MLSPEQMAPLRLRNRYGRVILLLSVLATLYYMIPLPGSLSSSISPASVGQQWYQSTHNGEAGASYESMGQPRARLPTPPLTTKHKTRNGRPGKYGPIASPPGARSQNSPTTQVKEKEYNSFLDQQSGDAPGTGSLSKADDQHSIPPPHGVHLPDSPDFTDPLEHQFSSWKPEDYIPRPPSARKPDPPSPSHSSDIPDPFPLLSRNPGPSRAELNLPPTPQHPRSTPETPLLIGFTRNWPQLLQCIVSYLAAGWPAQDIHVVENTGAMFANRDGRLGLQNPFFLNHTQLGMLGVNVIVTPTLLTFAQLQNFYAWTALEREWEEFFWSHQDVVVFSPFPDGDDGDDGDTLHARASEVLAYLRQPGVPKWANHFFAYDHLTLVHRDAILDVGGWDTHIPYYATDCDMYNRLGWEGYWQGETKIGVILDVGTVLDDVAALLRIPGVNGSFKGDPGPGAEQDRAEKAGTGKGQKVVGKQKQRTTKAANVKTKTVKPDPSDSNHDPHHKQSNGYVETWEHLVELGCRMEDLKYTDGGGWRNSWQLRQTGGRGEPFYRDAEGFEIGLRMMIDTGRAVFAEKWGHRGCDIAQIGLGPEDMWRVEKDWDPETEGGGSEGDDW